LTQNGVKLRKKWHYPQINPLNWAKEHETVKVIKMPQEQARVSKPLVFGIRCPNCDQIIKMKRTGIKLNPKENKFLIEWSFEL